MENPPRSVLWQSLPLPLQHQPAPPVTDLTPLPFAGDADFIAGGDADMHLLKIS